MRNGICYNKNGECDEERCRCNEDLNWQTGAQLYVSDNVAAHKKIIIKKSIQVTKTIASGLVLLLVVGMFLFQQTEIGNLKTMVTENVSVASSTPAVIDYQPQIDALRVDLAKATSSIAATNAKIPSTSGFVTEVKFDQLVAEISNAVSFLCSKVGCN